MSRKVQAYRPSEGAANGQNVTFRVRQNGSNCTVCPEGMLELVKPTHLHFGSGASGNGPQSALVKEGDLCRIAEGNQALQDIFRQSQEIHNLRDAGARNALIPSDFRHPEVGVNVKHPLPFQSHVDRMCGGQTGMISVGRDGFGCVNAMYRIRERLGNKWGGSAA